MSEVPFSRSNLGMVLPVSGDYLFVPDIRKAVEDKASTIKAYVVGDDLKEIDLKLGDLTDAEREIILKGCLINYYRG